MSYYRGDYYKRGYRGDYYRGDPGLFSFLGKALGGVAKIASGFLSGGPIGAIKAGINIISPASQGAPVAAVALPSQAFGGTLPGGSGRQRGLINIGGGDQTGVVNIDGGGPMVAGMRMRGYHLNKSTYETRGGGTSRWPQELELHQKGEVLVRNRRMNVGNARALKRSLRRISGFARLARRVMSFTHPRAGHGHFKFKRKRK